MKTKMPVQETLFPELKDLKPKLTFIPLNALPSNDELISPDPSASFIASVSSHGVQVPIVVQVTPGIDGYTILDGKRRVKAARLAGLAKLSAAIYTYEFDLSAIGVSINGMRSVNPNDILNFVETLTVQGKTPEDIEKTLKTQCGVAKSMTRTLCRIHSFPPALKRGISEGRIPITVAIKAASLPMERLEKLADTYSEGYRLTVADIKSSSVPATEKQLEIPKEKVFTLAQILETLDMWAADFPEEVDIAERVKSYFVAEGE